MRGFDHATIFSSSFHGVCKERLAQWPTFCVPNTTKTPGGVLPEKLGGGVQHPSPISDQNLWFSLPYFRPKALEPGAWPERITSCYGTYTIVVANIKREIVLSPNDEEVASSSKNIPNSRLQYTNHTLFQTKMVETDTLFQTKTAEKPSLLAPHIPIYIAYIRDYPPRRKARWRS